MVALCSSVYAERRQLQCFRQNRHRFLSLTLRLLIRIQRTSPKSPSISFPPPPLYFLLPRCLFFSSSLAVLHIGRERLEQRGELLVSHHNNDCVSRIHSKYELANTWRNAHNCCYTGGWNSFKKPAWFSTFEFHDSRWERESDNTCWNQENITTQLHSSKELLKAL